MCAVRFNNEIMRILILKMCSGVHVVEVQVVVLMYERLVVGGGGGGCDNRKQRILLCDVTSRLLPNARSESDV